MKNRSIVQLAAGLASAVLIAGSAQAQTFLYNPTDLLLGFRNGGANDFVVDLGPISSFYNYNSVLPKNTSILISAYSGSQLNFIFGSLDNISFSAFASVRTTGNPSFPIQTIWTTSPRMDLNTLSAAWSSRSQFQQANTAAKMDGIANGAVTYSGTLAPNPILNTSTAVEVPTTWNANGTAYTVGVGLAGNFAGTFPGDVENTTPVGFSSGGSPIASDLFALQPGTAPGTYMGTFRLGADGNMTFTTVPEPGTLSLLGAGLGLLGLTTYFRRKS